MLNLYNTLTQKIEPFKPSKDNEVKIYTCGPSTYQPAHIGNYRTFLFEDILQRYLEYLGYNVKRLMTLTDVEDKALAQAKKENLTVEELTTKNEAIFFREFELLRIKKPNYAVRASKVVDQAVSLILKLIEVGYAYFYTYMNEKNVYFEPLKYKGFGKLAHIDMNKWPKKKRRFHKDTYPGTPWNQGDFILWHGCEQEAICDSTSIGRGRPSWNIQDAAIVTKYLGFTVDIGAGGIDNLVRHHDYTLAVIEAVSGRQFSKYWLHGGHLFVDGKKMSKSIGNVYYLSDILNKGFSSSQLRFFLIYGHYRQKLNFTFKKLSETILKLDSLKALIKDLQNTRTTDMTGKDVRSTTKILENFENTMNNDLNVESSFDNLYEIVKERHRKRHSLSAKELKKTLDDLHKIDYVMQCLF